jgi:predicted transcriptional regulator
LSLTSEQVRAARMLLRWEQKDLAEASGVSLPSIKRLETHPGELGAQDRTIQALVRALEKAGVEFIPENGGGAGVRLAKRSKRSK